MKLSGRLMENTEHFARIFLPRGLMRLSRPLGRAARPGRFAARSLAVVVFTTTILALPGYGQGGAALDDVQADTVRDARTRLTWERVVSSEKRSFAAAATYCAELVLGGYDDWRVPSMQEFQTIVDEGRSRPAIDPGLFPGTPAESFWSGTSWAETSQLAWHVDFDTGSAAYDWATMLFWTRCVRFGPEAI